MSINEAIPEQAGGTIPLLVAADLQDHLMTASNDLDRLQRLLADSCDTLSQSFLGVSRRLSQLINDGRQPGVDDQTLNEALAQLGGAVTALQFQDMASQLIHHMNRRLRSCADTLAREAFADDEDGEAVVEQAPLKPNPVTQDEMDAGSIELF